MRSFSSNLAQLCLGLVTARGAKGGVIIFREDRRDAASRILFPSPSMPTPSESRAEIICKLCLRGIKLPSRPPPIREERRGRGVGPHCVSGGSHFVIVSKAAAVSSPLLNTVVLLSLSLSLSLFGFWLYLRR